MAVEVETREPGAPGDDSDGGNPGGGKPPGSWQEVGFLLVVGLFVGFLLTAVIGLAAIRAVTDPDDTEVAGETAAGDGEVVEFIATEYEFTPSDAVTGQSLEVVLDNQGVEFHNLEIEGIDGFVVEAQPGATGEASLEIAAGDYVIFCSVPGHQQLGMEGTLTVE